MCWVLGDVRKGRDDLFQDVSNTIFMRHVNTVSPLDLVQTVANHPHRLREHVSVRRTCVMESVWLLRGKGLGTVEKEAARQRSFKVQRGIERVESQHLKLGRHSSSEHLNRRDIQKLRYLTTRNR